MPSLDSCCEQHYSYDYDTCMIKGGADQSKFVTNHFWYPEWGSNNEFRCLNDKDHTRKQWGIELFESLEECCQGKLQVTPPLSELRQYLTHVSIILS